MNNGQGSLQTLMMPKLNNSGIIRLEKYETNIDDLGGKRRYSRNIPQWSKNDFKRMKSTNGDYLIFC